MTKIRLSQIESCAFKNSSYAGPSVLVLLNLPACLACQQILLISRNSTENSEIYNDQSISLLEIITINHSMDFKPIQWPYN